MAGEAFQFDWSEDWAIISGERTKLQVAHFKLSYSRAFVLRAYPQQTHEMLFDAHNHAFRVLGGAPWRGIYDNLWTSPAQGDLLVRRLECTNLSGLLRDDCAPLALMGVRCFWPHNMIGHEGLVVDQAWKFAVVADEPSGVTSHPRRPPLQR